MPSVVLKYVCALNCEVVTAVDVWPLNCVVDDEGQFFCSLGDWWIAPVWTRSILIDGVGCYADPSYVIRTLWFCLKKYN